MPYYPLRGVTGAGGEYIRLQEFQVSIPELTGVSNIGTSGNVLIDQGDNTFVFGNISGQGFSWEGTWQTGELYSNYNLVEYLGSSYIATGSPPVGTEPSETIYWDLVAQSGTTQTYNRVELDLSFKQAYNGNSYSEITRVSGQISQIDIWDNDSKLNKLFTKSITRVSGQISEVSILDEQTSNILLTNISRLSGNIDSITKTYTVI